MNTWVRLALGGLAVLGVGALALAAVVAAQPSVMHVERSAVVGASPEVVQAHTTDYHRFVEWNPWMGLDPNQTMTFSEPADGVGAWYTWKGNSDVGSGRMETTAIEPGKRTVQDLEFFEPFESKAVVTLTFVPEGGGTKVTWGFDSDQDFMGKAFGLVVDMDTMLGADFEKGLASLKTQVESSR